jgi:hypothetical protein
MSAQTEAQRCFDALARRLLREQLEADAVSPTPRHHERRGHRRADQPAPLGNAHQVEVLDGDRQRGVAVS